MSLRLLFALACAVLTVLAGATARPAAAEPTNFRGSATADVVFGRESCCAVTILFRGETVLPHVGRATFQGFLVEALPTQESYFIELRVTFTAANGDELVLSGVSTTRGAQTWTVATAESTGRFARFRGSGTFTFGPSIYAVPITFHFAGSLLPAAR